MTSRIQYSLGYMASTILYVYIVAHNTVGLLVKGESLCPRL